MNRCNLKSASPNTFFIGLLLCALSAILFSAAINAQSKPDAARFSDPQEDLRHVLELIAQRLALMPDVAAWKWEAKQPILDAPREAQVLDRAVADAVAFGLDGEAARQFFDLQIRMARSIQHRYFEDWRIANTSVPKARDLNQELRPALDALGRELLIAIYSASNSLPQSILTPDTDEQINSLSRYRGVEPSQLAELRLALAAMRVSAPATLARVQRVGLLRVGTTGDYAPFSSEQEQTLRGFDIQMAIELAQRWNVKIKFVRTTWPTLMSDYQQHRFDIAASGISVTPERAAIANFSVAYHVDGKTPIVRCEDTRKYSSLKRIDRHGVRVIENPGGTNERFARERLSNANITIHSDNQTVFQELIARRADVMFTDGIEVALQVQRHPQLCSSMKAPITRASKALLLPRDEQIAREIDEWLAPQLHDGLIKQRLDQAVRDAL